MKQQKDTFSGTHRVEHPFPALFDQESRILILGSFPSVRSREQAFFYGHPQNRFWKTLAGVLSEPVPETVDQKRDFLRRSHIALWDVIGSCEIVGSSDSSIKKAVPNDLSEILKGAKIRQIFCNGARSFEYYKKYQEEAAGIRAVKLPSTSPANAAWSLERLIRAWSVIGDPLGAAPPGISRALLNWYDHHARVLPWRSDPSPYHVWISEIMLQQTRVEAVVGYYERWMDRLPSPEALAHVPDDILMKLWEGLGYYNRARNLKKAAALVMEEYGGRIPETVKELKRLPGIGDYTAGAIASIAYGHAEPALDGNGLRILSRLLADGRPIERAPVRRDLRREMVRLMDKDRPGDFNQALMDLGSAVCLPKGAPFCDVCPWETVCRAHKEGKEISYPVKKPRPARRIEDKTVLILEYEGRIALHKRPDGGLLSGLWEFPCLDAPGTAGRVEKQLRDWELNSFTIAPLPESRHLFSHVEWRMKGYYVRLASENVSADSRRSFSGVGSEKKLFDRMGWVFADRKEIEAAYAVPSAFAAYKKIISEQCQTVKEAD